ncbi:RsfA family transcriptional regulator [Mesobacillus sp. AQ2]|jgi:prespore-specific regulator|uniref:RsfA family transcriptional regulator n=1 Tax=unclassified Mesobacillus TaxID=2675270 RepID=UPI00203DE3F9|nr:MULTISPECIES: RsfA family transcriptional regulator [unclassified Mesobacillus]MCM3123420.1 RsfA family transcriptional regulator [Mesobacillus sp. MER 33]MCM3233097.1 RsfA family transcriptional regulator [Mesobacillus sp. MER 48]WHX42171.1 RsfA family transcriptional regulator [Mesobacillus sp. AQ2]
MPLTRQDAWSQDEDLLLAEVVLRNIREGGTQLKAFEEVGKQLSRTAAACGFRWNSYVRKQYKSGIELAKKQRKEAKKQVKAQEVTEEAQAAASEMLSPVQEKQEKQSNLSIEAVKQYLDDLYEKAGALNSQDDQKEKIRGLEKQIYYLSAENEKLETKLRSMEEDYRALIDIMERAKKRVGPKDEEKQQKMNFQVEGKGNLEKVEK